MNARPGFGLKSLTLVAVLLFSNFIPAYPVQANPVVNVEIGIFHDAMTPYGNWVNHRTYGQVWYPRNVARNWRPYTDGYWAHTEDYGWLWVSYEPWGWAPYHYGRWAWDNWYGWIWVPGRTWAPAWVFWRSGGGYAAWTPMPPNVLWQEGIGLNTSYFDYDRDLRWDSWVAVREYDLPHRHINRLISPPDQNRQVLNVTNYTNNNTLINNNIVNQGVPVSRIEEVTRRPIESVAPRESDRADIATDQNHDEQPKIIRLPMGAPTTAEIHHNEELARRMDGKNEDGTRTEVFSANSGEPGAHEPGIPGRLIGAPAPAQSPYATPEPQNKALAEPLEQVLAQPAMPGPPLVGINLDSDTQNQRLKLFRDLDGQAPAQTTVYQPHPVVQSIVSVPPEAEGTSAQEPVTTDQQPVSTIAAVMPPQKNELQPLESAKQTDIQPPQYPAADQQQKQRQQLENIQPQQAERVVEQSQAIQQAEPARQPDMQNQQPLEIRAQVAEREVEQSQPIQQPEPVRQPDMQNQQPVEIQPQQAEREVEQSQPIQQPEPVRQPDMQNQQPVEIQPQQAEREVEQSQPIQQPEPVRQPDTQNQQPTAIQPQQAEREVEQAQPIQQPEPVRQPDTQNQQPTALQPQQAEREVEQAQPIQQPEPVSQPDMQNQPQSEKQRKQQQETAPQ